MPKNWHASRRDVGNVALNTEQLRDNLESEYPIDVMGIYINRSGIRVQYREHHGDERIDRQLRKTQLMESVNSFIKKAAYMDAQLDRNSKMMLQLESGDADITIQRVSNVGISQAPKEYRVRQDVLRNTENQYLFATKYYPLDSKKAADITAQTLREYVCSEDEKKYVLELQHLGALKQYTSLARFHTSDSYSTIMGLETQG